VNALGTENAVKAEQSSARLVFVSSGGAIYGEANRDKGITIGPISPYGRSKLAAERVVRESGPVRITVSRTSMARVTVRPGGRVVVYS
jgi:nucleoside-diphosphate-sugar epimerase